MATLVFDYDGTLHDCIQIYAPAFCLAYEQLTARGLMPPRKWAEEEISVWLGYSAADMWNSFAPQLSQQEKDKASQSIGTEMLRLVGAGQARLYPGVTELLLKLKNKGHTLVLLSNCNRDYMEAHCTQFSLGQYFSAFYCGEDFGWKPKHEIFAQIKNRFAGPFIIIGDRFQDFEIAQMYGLMSIGCGYGYGSDQEWSKASVVVYTPAEIDLYCH